MRAVLICPEALIAAGRQLARCKGAGSWDEQTFDPRAMVANAAGTRFAFASGDYPAAFIQGLRQPLILPPWGADMVLAGQAQAALDELLPGEDGSWPALDPTRISFVLGYSGPVVMELFGLTWVQPPAP